ncbi:hypothetical protein Amsp01_093880 [Amycolatopsis sp. NBRC 101858]|uniref:hypothetical protein n=1 Tax=Amycolatopsis sp. NBRC 101858 TaxID=3032200 RepID=UPI0024A4AA3C|nr:hypothetical protein [Amycolatopsis sp. NBRC 101858]GLY43365.1 hypothetical protein Amsp01_093880 [Amycolatopsis sp. NBRC 101858]
MSANRKRTYLVSGLLALVAVVCAVIAATAGLAYLQYVAIGFFCAAIACLAQLLSRRAG